jgi:hypothetical protein
MCGDELSLFAEEQSQAVTAAAYSLTYLVAKPSRLQGQDLDAIIKLLLAVNNRMVDFFWDDPSAPGVVSFLLRRTTPLRTLLTSL